MRKIILYIASSLDGFIATPSGGIDWLFTDNDYGYTDFLASIDTVLMGRKTYEQVLGFGEYPYKDKRGFVFTRSHSAQQDANVTFIRDNVQPFIESLHQSPGQDIWLVGGGELIKLFMQHHWVDNIILSIHPVVLGNGIPLFLPTQEQPQWFKVENVQTFDSGLVQLSYMRSDKAAIKNTEY